MKPIIWNLADWCVLATIFWAYDQQTLMAMRLLDAAAIWVWIVNLLTLTYLLDMLAFKEARDQMRIEKQKHSKWQKTHNWVCLLISLAVFAWIGWVWTFGIRLFKIFAIEILNKKYST